MEKEDGVMTGFIQNAIEDSSAEDETHFILSSNRTAQKVMTRECSLIHLYKTVHL